MGYYAQALVCRNGHVVTDNTQAWRANLDAFCSKCGAPTINACERCGIPIRGEYVTEHVAIIGFGASPAPTYCFSCGEAFPWTSTRLAAARELAEESEALSAAEKDQLEQSLGQITSDNPKTQVAAVRIKKLLLKLPSELGSAIRDIVVDVASEAAKKAILGP